MAWESDRPLIHPAALDNMALARPLLSRESPMPIPSITHLQFLVLGLLMDAEISGRELRERLVDAGERKSGPAFYQFMARLEDARLVEGSYDEKVIDGQRIKERRYKITGQGIAAWEEVRDFYLTQVGFGLQGA